MSRTVRLCISLRQDELDAMDTRIAQLDPGDVSQKRSGYLGLLIARDAIVRNIPPQRLRRTGSGRPCDAARADAPHHLAKAPAMRRGARKERTLP